MKRCCAKSCLAVAAAMACVVTAACTPDQPTSTPATDTPTAVKQTPENDAADGEEGGSMDLPTWDGSAPATFTCTSEEAQGVVYSFAVPSAETHELIAQMEALREAVGVAEKPGYLVVEIDATKTTKEQAGVALMQWATLEQTSVEAGSAWELVSTWQDGIDIEDTDLYNQAVDVYNAALETAPVRGAKGQEILVTDSPITSMVAPTIMPDIATYIPCELS